MMYDLPMHEGRALPHFSLREIDLPQIKDWEVSGKYFLLVKVEMVGKYNRKDLDSKVDKSKVEGDFQVLSIKAVEHDEYAEMDSKAFEKVVAKAKSGKL